MLEQKGHVRGEGAEECKKDSELKQGLDSEKSLGPRGGVLPPPLVRAIG
jgi:hypothetical protein